MKLSELLNTDALAQSVKDGWVKIQRHPEFRSLCVAKYTKETAYENHWDEITRACRGLIYDEATGEVLARPFPKFMNDTQYTAEELAAWGHRPVQMTDKLDGSAIVLFRNPYRDNRLEGATLGSFASEQANYVNRPGGPIEALRDSGWVERPGTTYICELIWWENRIVLNYSPTGLNWPEGLYFLGAVDIETGETRGPNEGGWSGYRAEVFQEGATFAEALRASRGRQSAEGVVVRFLDDGMMVKVKESEYIKLHAIFSYLDNVRVWEAMSGLGSPYSKRNPGPRQTREEFISPLPDELHVWAGQIWTELEAEVERLHRKIDVEFQRVLTGFEEPIAELQTDSALRKRFAQAVRDSYGQHKELMFSKLDGKDNSIANEVFLMAKPKNRLAPAIGLSDDDE